MKRRFLIIFMSLIIIFSLTGCRQKSDSENAYRLPLGDAGYVSEMDFGLYKNVSILNGDGNEVDKYDYNYLSSNSTNTIAVSSKVMDEKYADKAFRVSVGYYDSDKNYVALSDKVIGNIVYGESFTKFVFTYNSAELSEEITKGAVIKLEFGTNIDEEYYKTNNEGAKANAINKYRKSYKGSTFYFDEVSINDNNVLYETSVNGTKKFKENSSLHFYNTSTVATAENNGKVVTTIKLNSKTGPWQWIIEMLGRLLHWITNLVGGYYWLGLLIFTILIRSIGWPIYAKTNSFSTNMSKVQPELDKLNKKYEGKTDQNSKMKQQMEMRQIMKKNHVSMWGCLLPFAQMPIFFAVYQVVQRFPLTPLYNDVNYKFFGTTFAMNYGQASGHWLLAVLVGVTMIGSQLISTYMSKRVQRKKANFYTAKTQQTNKSIFIMMAVMTVMMVVFAWNSSGIAFYWIIGNIYQIGQTFISKVQEEKKEDKLQRESGRARGRN